MLPLQMYTLWAVTMGDGGNGTEIYGDDYADIWAINRLHFKAATPPDCDHVSSVYVFIGRNIVTCFG